MYSFMYLSTLSLIHLLIHLLSPHTEQRYVPISATIKPAPKQLYMGELFDSSEPISSSLSFKDKEIM